MNNFQLLSLFGAGLEENPTLATIVNFLPIVAVIAVFYFFLIRPQQKKDKEDRAMRENLDIGDEIVTAGGIIGLVVSIKDDTIVIETGSDRSKVRLAKWAVAQNLSAKEKASSAEK